MHENNAVLTLGRATADIAALSYGIALNKHATLFESLFNIIKQHLQCGDRNLSRRLIDQPDDIGAALMEVDEAIEVLERDDHKQVKEAQDNDEKNEQSTDTLWRCSA